MFAQKQWYLKRRTRLYVGSNELKSSFGKFKGSIFAILFGLICGSLVIAATGNNAFTYFKYVINFAFSSYRFNNWDNTLVWWALYIVAGLALVVSFKIGMFNIGAPGQLLASGAVIVTIGVRYNMSQPLTILFAFVAAVLAAMLVAGFIVLLKVLFNVHEVVSSILLNWTIWYFIKWIFTTSNDLYNSSQGASNPVSDTMSLVVNGYRFIIPIILAFILVFFVWFLLKKTTLGYKFKTVGQNPFAAQYAGINKKHYAVISFLLSGALIGVMGFIYYVGFNPSLSFSTNDLPTLGFDSISVALVGQISAIGVVASAFLWGVVKSGALIGSTGLNIPSAVSDIIFGVIIYSAACAILLSRLEPIKFTIRYGNMLFNTHRKNEKLFITVIWKKWLGIFKVKRNFKHKINLEKKQINKIKKLNKNQASETNERLILEHRSNLEHLISERNENIEILWSQIHQEWKSLSHSSFKEYNKIWRRGLIGINNKATMEKKALYGEKLNAYVSAKIAYDEFIYNNRVELKNQITMIKQTKAEGNKEKINSLNIRFKSNVSLKIKEFKQTFLAIVDQEQQQLAKINENYQSNKNFYKKKANELKVAYQQKVQKINEEKRVALLEANLSKPQINKIKSQHKSQLILIKNQYKIEKNKFAYIEKNNLGEN